MACFLVSAAEAVVVTIAEKAMEKKEKEKAPEAAEVVLDKEMEAAVKIPFSTKLKWLRNMLWGGAFLLAFEHIWHGEVTPWFPFLTAMNDPADAAEMFHEMATVGVCMALLVTTVWLGMVGISVWIEKRAQKAKALPSES